MGFLSLGTVSIPGNQGLRDMVTLLHWVQRNARGFGGDPRNVTLMGQSAGAASAHLLSLSPAAKGLFKRWVFLCKQGTGRLMGVGTEIVCPICLRLRWHSGNFKLEQGRG